jgi:hypothetical protein
MQSDSLTPTAETRTSVMCKVRSQSVRDLAAVVAERTRQGRCVLPDVLLSDAVVGCPGMAGGGFAVVWPVAVVAAAAEQGREEEQSPPVYCAAGQCHSVWAASSRFRPQVGVSTTIS